MTDLSTLSTQPEAPVAPKGFGPWGWARWAWRTLTSMRTALLLLFLLALASVPGSLLPQRGTSPLRVDDYVTAHPTLGPLFDRLSLFDVFAAPWFAAVYLLLFVSLAGCVLPRSWKHAQALRARPPRPPRRLDRLPAATGWQASAAPEAAAEALRGELRRRRFRIDRHDEAGGAVALAAEKGYLRETGNLLFHLALLALLAGVALGGAYGYKGTKLVVEGDGFANTVNQYDSIKPGRAFSPSALAPFSLTLRNFDASYQTSGPERGAASSFHAHVTYRTAPGAPERPDDIRVNHPLVVGSTKVYLVNHGYAPHVVIRGDDGKVAFDGAVPFLPADTNFTSNGVIKAPDAGPAPHQLGFQGVFLPDAVLTANGFASAFPAAKNPRLDLLAYRGDLGLDSGRPQSVYSLDDTKLARIGRMSLTPGQSAPIPGGKGSVTFVGLDQWVIFQVTYDPGKQLALCAAVLMIAGLLLSLRIRRRRIFVRVSPAPGPEGAGRSVVEVGGLARNDSAGGALAEELRDLVARFRAVVPPAPESKE